MLQWSVLLSLESHGDVYAGYVLTTGGLSSLSQAESNNDVVSLWAAIDECKVNITHLAQRLCNGDYARTNIGFGLPRYVGV